MRIALVVALVWCAYSWQASACTTFGFDANGTRFMGKSYDWSEDHGMVVINKRNIEKEALMVASSSEPLVWTSQFASITFNQHGRDFPVGGINEAGLAVEIMLGTMEQAPSSDPRKAVNEVQWIQFVLDSYGSVAEMVADVDNTRIQKLVVEAHYLVCDRLGECASAEYLDGELVLHNGRETDLAQVFANSTYGASYDYLGEHVGFGGTKPIPTDSGSLSRFVRAAHLVKQVNEREESQPVVTGFEIANSVAGSGVWRLVYNLERSEVTIKLGTESRGRTINLDDFDLDCSSPTLVYDLAGNESGDITDDFQEYNITFNRRIINQSRMVPWFLKETAAKYPDTNTNCLSARVAEH